MPNLEAAKPIDKAALEKFLTLVPNLSQVIESQAESVTYFGYYLSEEAGETNITPKKIRACYEAAALPVPSNISFAMRRSHAFVSTTAGTKLHRDAKSRIEKSLGTSHLEVNAQASIAEPKPPERARNIVVIHGRDATLRDSMFQLLRSLSLTPVEWTEAVHRTGRGAPYTGEVVDALFQDAQAVIAIFSPDEHVELRTDLQSQDVGDNNGWQPRPNVFIETGMALARDEAHTVLVQIGAVRQASDLLGRNLVHFDGSPSHRHELVERLRTAGCAVSTSGSEWLRTGNFKISSESFKEKRRRTK
jgi:predicted nucleotide-binding protein